MAIGNININEYKYILGENQSSHDRFRHELPTIIRDNCPEMNMNEIDLYNLKEEFHNNKSGTVAQRVCIFVNASFSQDIQPPAYDLPEGTNVLGFKRFMPPLNTKETIVIVSEDGIPIAEWREETHELNILFNVFEKHDANAISAFTYIMRRWNELVWYIKSLQDSWKHTSDRETLTKTFTRRLEQQKQRDLDSALSNINSLETQIREYARAIKTNTDNIGIKRRFVAVETENLKDVSIGLIKDLDLIIGHPKVKDLKIKDDKFIIYTHPLIITSDKGKRYYGGEYRFELHPSNSDIRFFGSNTRRGLWTHNDPHPHVDGSDGHACLGNTSSTIAELSSQMQIYALALIGIDFLESANTADSAGANVIRWAEVDKDGKLIGEGTVPIPTQVEEVEEEYEYYCEDCGAGINEHHTVFNYIDNDGDPHEEHQVCDECRSTNYTFDTDIDEYINDNWER